MNHLRSNKSAVSIRKVFVPEVTPLISRSVERLRDTTGTRRENTPRS